DRAGHAPQVDDAASAPIGHGRRQSGYEKVGGTNVDDEERVEPRAVEIGGRAEPRSSDVVDQHVDLAGLFGQAVDLVDIHQLGSDKAGSAPFGFDGSDDLSASLRVAAMDDNVPSVSGQAQRSRSADAVGRPGHERCSNSSSGCTHRILISLQNGRTRASPLSPWEAQERIWRLTLTQGETQ